MFLNVCVYLSLCACIEHIYIHVCLHMNTILVVQDLEHVAYCCFSRAFLLKFLDFSICLTLSLSHWGVSFASLCPQEERGAICIRHNDISWKLLDSPCEHSSLFFTGYWECLHPAPASFVSDNRKHSEGAVAGYRLSFHRKPLSAWQVWPENSEFLSYK